MFAATVLRFLQKVLLHWIGLVRGGVHIRLCPGAALDSESEAGILGKVASLSTCAIFTAAGASPTAIKQVEDSLRQGLSRQYGAQRECTSAMIIASTASEDIVGMCGIILNPPPAAMGKGKVPVARLAYMAVEPTFRRRGIARRLGQACEDLAVCWGEEELYLFVDRENSAGRALYTRLGYRPCADDTTVELPEATAAPDMCMIKHTITPMKKRLARSRLAAHARRAAMSWA